MISMIFLPLFVIDDDDDYKQTSPPPVRLILEATNKGQGRLALKPLACRCGNGRTLSAGVGLSAPVVSVF